MLLTKNPNKIEKPEPAPKPAWFDTPKPRKEQNKVKIIWTLLNKIENHERNINTEIFNEYFKYQNTPFLVKDLCNVNQTKNKKIGNQVRDALIDFRNAVKKEIPQNENSDGVINIVEKALAFNKQQKVKALRISTPKQVLQGLTIELTQLKAG